MSTVSLPTSSTAKSASTPALSRPIYSSAKTSALHWNEIPSLRAVPTVSQWSFPAPPHVAHTKFITFDPHDSKTIYACIEQGAFLKSSDDLEKAGAS